MRDPAKEIFDGLNSETDLNVLITSQVENLYVDFKTKFNHAVKDVDQDLQKILSKGISGFANADGGVIIIGVDAPQNQTPTLKPITPYVEFEQEVNSYISRSTSFPVQGVEIKSFPIAVGGGVTAVLVPKSDLAPHCSMKDKKYYQRIGDSFLPMEHYQIADMFGKRHQPMIIPSGFISGDVNHSGRINLTFGIKNEGRAIARFLLLKIESNAGFTFNKYGLSGNGHFGLDPFPSPTSYSSYRGGADIVIHPGTDLMVTKMEFQCQGSPQQGITHPTNGLVIEGSLAADDFPIKRWAFTIPQTVIQNFVTNPRLAAVQIDGALI